MWGQFAVLYLVLNSKRVLFFQFFNTGVRWILKEDITHPPSGESIISTDNNSVDVFSV